MPVHVFVDETKSRGLLMAAAHVPANDVAVNRKALRALLLPGQERLHFNHETPARRAKIIAAIKEFHLVVDLYQAETDTLAGRHLCLWAIVRDVALVAERLVVEQDGSVVAQDRHLFNQALFRFECFDSLRCDLLVPKADPLLWIPDAVAWCWVRGGRWRQSVASFSQLREV
jgi:hypothetical protein